MVLSLNAHVVGRVKWKPNHCCPNAAAKARNVSAFAVSAALGLAPWKAICKNVINYERRKEDGMFNATEMTQPRRDGAIRVKGTVSLSIEEFSNCED